ncbi:MAG: DUF3489 domain-containing protein [Terricaulis sp.]|nr:DUF3489 domain-containing protein [Terricaulis sp.]
MTAKPAKRRTTARTAKAKAKSAKPAVNASKLDQMVEALRTPKGACITDLMTLTGWQMHSVRGAIAGALKKKRGLKVSSTKANGERIYRIVARG